MSGRFLRGLVAALSLALGLSCQIRAQGIPEPGVILYGTIHAGAGTQATRVTSGALVWTFTPSDGGAPVVISTQLTNINDQFSYVIQVPCETPVPGIQTPANTLRLANPAISYDRATVTLDGKPLPWPSTAPKAFTLGPTVRGTVERIDFGNAPAALETYEDWSRRIFGTVRDKNEDFDGDGMSNGGEYRAGTDPKDRLSLFEFVNVERLDSGQGARIQWSAVTGKTYSVLRAPVLSVNTADYSVIASKLSSTPPITTYVDKEAVSPRVFFYRIRVDEP